MKKKTINLTNKQEKLIQVLLVLSALVLVNLLVPQIRLLFRAIINVLALITIILVLRKINITKINKKTLIISILLALYTIRYFLDIHIATENSLIVGLSIIFKYLFVYHGIVFMFGICSLPILTFYIYLFIDNIIPKVINFLKSLTKVEKRYLIIMTIIGTVLSIGITMCTTAFSNPVTKEGNMALYDVIYTSDNGALSQNDAYTSLDNPENDLRQPMFAVFALPFSIPAHIISEILPFSTQNMSYYIVMTIIQFILITITTIMIARLLKLEESKKKYLYILFSISFPYIIFSLLLEQYVMALFYLILTIYLYNEEKGINNAYIGAVSTLLTSGVIFPLISNKTSIKDKIIDIFKCFLVFCSILILSGRVVEFLNVFEQITNLSAYTGVEVTWLNKVQQFTHFISSLFIGPLGEITTNPFANLSWQIQPITTFSILGIVILILCIISAIINRKEYITKVSFLWIIFSMIMLVILGWGTKENGLILYSLYFGWAYFVLIFQLLNNIFKNNKVFKIAFIILILLMVIGYIPELFNIFKFAILNY
jgi:hypothetical protein